MTILAFPPVENADEHGLLAYGGDLEVNSLLLAYRSGIFPWPHQDYELLWFSPPKRAILKLNDYRPSKSLLRLISRGEYQFFKNKNFSACIEACANVKRANQAGTWISNNMIKAYTMLHLAGYADSYEIYEQDLLVGGLYGVRIGNFFAAESMFHRADNASKLAIYHLVEDLKRQGIPWFDCQVMNPFLEKIGVREIKRRTYLKLLKRQLTE